MQAENLDRGLVSVRSGSANLVSWRLLGTETTGVAFNLYRGGTRVNATPITGATNYLDSGAAAGTAYTVRAVVDGAEQAASAPALQFPAGYLDVPLQVPPGGTTPSGEAYTYSANDASVGDLDGDGRYEFVLKWEPSNAKDNSQSGYTGNVYVDAYTLTGTRLWRIDLGRNIRAGAHYTQFQVYDYDGDGRAEVAMKTADGTRSGAGQVIGNANADHRNSSGYVLAGPEYLTMFDGRTGAALSTVNYDPPRGTVSSWGDNYGNRVDRFLAATAYLDGQRPSLIMARGYYTRAVIAAWDFRNGTLTKRWTFDSNTSGNGAAAGQGNHNLSVADVDGDGRQEIVYGAATIDDNGRLLHSTATGHGDAMHVGDLDPTRPGLEVFKVNEDGSKPSSYLADARTGQLIWSTPANGDNGRGVSGDIWAGSPGAESWSSAVSGLANTRGQNVGRKPSSTNFLIWWDGDPVRELLDATRIDKYGTERRHPPAHRRRRGREQRHQGHARALGRPARRLAGRGGLAHHRQPGATDLQHPDDDQHPAAHPDARPAVPGRGRLAEHRLQPTAAPELLHRRRDGHPARAPHLPALSRTGQAPGRDRGIRSIAARCPTPRHPRPVPTGECRTTTGTNIRQPSRRAGDATMKPMFHDHGTAVTCATAPRLRRPTRAPDRAAPRRPPRRSARTSAPGRPRRTPSW